VAAARAGIPTSWAPVDLAAMIAGESPIQRPEHLRRQDGVGLIYAAKQHAVYGEPESCKSFLVAAAAAHELRAGLDVVLFDFEDDAATWVERLLGLGTPAEMILAHFHYVRPDEPISQQGWRDLAPSLERACLVGFDSTNEAMALHGFNLSDNADVAKWMQIPRRCQRYGAAVVSVDHVAKDRESRGRFAIGAQAKLAAVDVAYSLRVVKPFGRGREGLVTIKVEKDRAGYGREYQAPDGQIAQMRLTSGAAGSIEIALEAPVKPEATVRPTGLMERVSRAVEGTPGLTKRALREAVRSDNKAKELALDVLVAEEFVRVERNGAGYAHHSVRPYRKPDDGRAAPALADSAARPAACSNGAPYVLGDRAAVPATATLHR
jgi:AAA domain-containing protein